MPGYDGYVTPDATPTGAAPDASLDERLPDTAEIVLPDAGTEYDKKDTAREDGPTRLLPTVEAAEEPAPASARAHEAGAALGRAGKALRRHAERAADRFGASPVEVRVAMVGATVTVVSFLVLPYAHNTGTAAELGGRLWWRPIAAVLAMVLLATTLRPRIRRGTAAPVTAGDGASHVRSTVERLLAALVIATVGATEAGLVGLFSGDSRGTRIGYYGMLAGLVMVLVAAARAARRRCAGVAK